MSRPARNATAPRPKGSRSPTESYPLAPQREGRLAGTERPIPQRPATATTTATGNAAATAVEIPRMSKTSKAVAAMNLDRQVHHHTEKQRVHTLRGARSTIEEFNPDVLLGRIPLQLHAKRHHRSGRLNVRGFIRYAMGEPPYGRGTPRRDRR